MYHDFHVHRNLHWYPIMLGYGSLRTAYGPYPNNVYHCLNNRAERGNQAKAHSFCALEFEVKSKSALVPTHLSQADRDNPISDKAAVKFAAKDTTF